MWFTPLCDCLSSSTRVWLAAQVHHRTLLQAVYERAAGDARTLTRLRMGSGCMVYVVKACVAKLKQLHERDAKMAAQYGGFADQLRDLSVQLAGRMSLSMGKVCLRTQEQAFNFFHLPCISPCHVHTSHHHFGRSGW